MVGARETPEAVAARDPHSCAHDTAHGHLETQTNTLTVPSIFNESRGHF